MENSSLIIILIIALIFAYYTLNKKISQLEDEISELRKNTTKSEKSIEAKEEKTSSEVKFTINENIQEAKPVDRKSVV